MDNVLDLLLEAMLQKPHKTHLVVVPRLTTFLLINHMLKEAGLLFHEPLVVVGDHRRPEGGSWKQ